VGFFNLQIVTSVNVAGGNAPLLEVLLDGLVVGSGSVTAQTGLGTTLLSFTFEFSGTRPSSLAYRFSGSSGDGSDVVSIEAVRVNGQDIGGGNLNTTLLNRNQTSTQNINNTDQLFGRIEPTSGDLGTTTINGTAGNDSDLIGTAGADVIDGGAGQDYIAALDDDDAINGGAGDDRLFGQGGKDITIGGAGNDRIHGNDGDDLLFGQGDDDQIFGGAGDDMLNGGAGDDQLIGGSGNDILIGEGGSDRLIGVSGNNILMGDGGDDFLFGGINDDQLYGGADNDTLNGANGNDTLDGGSGNDFLNGGNGDDRMFGGDGEDRMLGENGTDTMSGSNGNDTMNGGDGNDIMNGDGGDDVMIGAAGIDTINGGAGDDVIRGHGIDARAISTILRANPDVFYSEETGSFYQMVLSGLNATAAATAAQITLGGATGHLAVLTTAAEFTLLNDLAGNDSYWLDGGDFGTEGNWVWTSGSEAGLLYWQGGVGGTLENNMYVNWEGSQPNDSNGTQDYAYLWGNGDGMADAGINGFTHSVGYIVEWESGAMSDDNANDILNGGDGDDWIYGYGGADTINGGNGVDRIFGGAGADIINGAGLINETEPFFADVAGLVSYAAGQDVGGVLSTVDNGTGFLMDGNVWKKLALNYTVTADTILEFEFKSTLEAEISAIGFENDNNFTNDGNRFKIWGTQNNGMNYAAPQSQFEYDGSGDWVSYQIDVGTFFTGVFSHLAFVNDDDAGGAKGNSFYRNIKIFDVSVVDTGSNTISGGDGGDTISGGSLADFLYGDDGNDIINGHAGDDFIDGGDANDELFGQDGNDQIFGENGQDDLYGGGGDDFLFGGAGDDRLFGGDGADTLEGGGGSDTFVFEAATAFSGIDTITDPTGADFIDISDLLIGYNAATDAISEWVETRDSGGNTIMSIDTDGGVGGVYVDILTINGLTGLDAATMELNGNLITS
jgi:Ca2+-binding RTX toxin-like protein